MQASARTSLCRLYTDMCAHAHTQHMQPIIHLRPKALAVDATAVPHAHFFISLYLWVPQITLTVPQVHKLGHFLQSKRLKTFTPSVMCCYPSFLSSQFFSSSIGELSGFSQLDARFNELDKQFSEHVEQSVLELNTASSQSIELPKLGSQSKSLPN